MTINLGAVYHKPAACRVCGCTQDLPADLQTCPCRCHPANWEPNIVQEILSAMVEYRKWFDTCTRTGNPDWEEQAANASQRLDDAIAKTEADNA